MQRVSKSSIDIDGVYSGSIGQGLLILLGVTHSDSEKDAVWLAEKCAGLRIFSDADGKMNLSLTDIGGEAMIVSQFTLYGDCRKGKRPGFSDAAAPETAIPLYEKFIELMRSSGVNIVTGRFGADMEISLSNSGPVTLMLESKQQEKT